MKTCLTTTLAAVGLAALLTGCGDGSSSSTPSGTPPPAAPPAPAAPKAPEAPAKPAEVAPKPAAEVPKAADATKEKVQDAAKAVQGAVADAGAAAQAQFSTLKSIKMAYCGDARFNMGNSLMVGCAKMGLDFVACAPKQYFPQAELTETCKALAKQSGGSITQTEDIYAGVADAEDVGHGPPP